MKIGRKWRHFPTRRNRKAFPLRQTDKAAVIVFLGPLAKLLAAIGDARFLAGPSGLSPGGPYLVRSQSNTTYQWGEMPQRTAIFFSTRNPADRISA